MPSPVRAWIEDLVIPTYLPSPPDRNPMFLEKRVYQGSSGRVYPLPFTDRISEVPVDRVWKAVWLENRYLRVLLLPELGGRIHAMQDLTNGYDVIYRQETIKPALVGLAGPWISGGIEFNWPQHHRPATFLPVDFRILEGDDGSKTVWCGDHDPMSRMKGLHGVCLHPDRSYLELKVVASNRTPFVRTFLWWANVATRVHADYQSFFPPDVTCVADHAKRATSAYPRCDGVYYGVDYGARGRGAASEIGNRAGADSVDETRERCVVPGFRPDDLSFYANIPTPCSYMATGSREDFFGGYDHRAQAGIVHVANRHIAPGKKQWTWGNHPFGYAWDRNLTDPTTEGEYRPYIELMAGVYTDNQPDFSFLQPGETRTWSQYWYPIREIGPVQQANLRAAASLSLGSREVRLGVGVTEVIPGARVVLDRISAEPSASRTPNARAGRIPASTKVREWCVDLDPGHPLVVTFEQPSIRPWTVGETRLRLLDSAGNEVLMHQPVVRTADKVPPPASEPAAPETMASADELFLTGLHLEQYRHATRCPTLYWREALRRDVGDARCNNAMGRWHLERGEWGLAEAHFRRAIARWTGRNPNPYDGEPFYQLGLCLRHRAWSVPDPELVSALEEEAYAAFYKATWNQAWAGPGYHALAEIDAVRGNWEKVMDHCERSSRQMSPNGRLANLWALATRRLGNPERADAMLRVMPLDRDPLDWWALHQRGEPVTCDWQTRLDLAHDMARAGLFEDAIAVLSPSLGEEALREVGAPGVLPTPSWGAAPMVEYTLGWLNERRGLPARARKHYRRAARLPVDYCFPSRLEEIAVLEAAMRAEPGDARAPYYLGNLLYDRRRHEEAIRFWERSTELDPSLSVVWRNLGIGWFNVRRQPARARKAYDRAFAANPGDARLLYERDQLWKRIGLAPSKRLRELQSRPQLVRLRDDLSVELAALLNQLGRHAEARELMGSRKFQPWEGGEGLALGQHVRTRLALGREALGSGDVSAALEHFRSALESPENLGEARHLLANDSDVRYWLGCALEAAGDRDGARSEWRRAATFSGDFKDMSVRTFSELTRYSALAWEKLGQPARARRMFRALLAHARDLRKSPARVDYFATSLPTMLLFDDDLKVRQDNIAWFLEAQAMLGLGGRAGARALLRRVLQRDPSHGPAADLLAELSAPQGPGSVPRRLAGRLSRSVPSGQ